MIKTLCCFTLIFILFIQLSKAQDATNYAVQANIIYRFTKYIDWPDYRKSGDFVIGIVGNSPIYNHLKLFLGNKTVGIQKIVVRQFSSSATSFNCHMLFVGEDACRRLKKIVSVTEGDAILLVAENDRLTKKGSCISFCMEEERLRLEINKSNIEARELSVASELLNLAVLVQN